MESIFWHPSLKALVNRCCDFPLSLESNVEAVQAVHLNDHVYIGGASGSDRDNCRLFIYSLSADNWNVIDTRVSRFALTSYKSKVVLIGGRQRDPPHGNAYTWIYSNKVSMLDSNLDVQDHDVVVAMQTKRASACATSYEDYLIVVGGEESSNTNTTVEIYDGSHKRWLFVTPLPKSGIVKSAVMLSNSIWNVQLFGSGAYNRSENYIYYLNLSTIKDNLQLMPTTAIASIRGTWQKLSLKTSHTYQTVSDSGFTSPHVCSNLATYHDQLILIGRDKEHSSDHSFFVYSLDANRWMAVAGFPPKELERHIDPLSQHMQALDNIHLLSISDKELLLLGKLAQRRYRDIFCRVSFQSK